MSTHHHPNFLFICSSTLLNIRQSNGSSAAPITVTSSTWDHYLHQFSAPRRWQLPLAGELELLAASVVENYEFGEFRPHLAIRRKSNLLIGLLGVAEENFTELVEVALPVNDVGNSKKSTLNSFVKECWITDGPVLVALCEEDLLIARYKSTYEDTSNSVDQTMGHLWNAYVLHLKDLGDGMQIRTIYCGDLRNFGEPELLLNIQNISMEVCPGTAMSERSNNEWMYLSLPLHTFSFSERNLAYPADCASRLSWLTVPCCSVFRYCKELFPPDIDPSLIACVEFVPANQSAVSLSIWPHENSKLTAVPSNLVIALYNGKLLKSKLGCIVTEVDLQDVPVSLQFAVVAESQGILLAIFKGIHNKVVVLCAETLEQLQVWTGVQEAVLGDLQMLGHDQMILLSNPKFESHDLTTFSSKEYFGSMQITDLINSVCTGEEQPQQSDCTGATIKDHRAHSLKAIAQSLQSRLEAGIAWTNQLKEKRAAKIELLCSSCELMQDMVAQHETPAAASSEVSGSSEKSGVLSFSKKSKYIQATTFQKGTCGRTWFLMIEVQSVAPRDIVLQNVNLLLTTIEGEIIGTSSVADSLCAERGRKRLVAAVPLKNVPALAYPAQINVMVSAEVLGGDDRLGLSAEATLHDFQKEKRNYWLHTEWLGQVDCITLARSYEPENVPLDFREVAPKETLIMRARTEKQKMEFVDLVCTATHMKIRQNTQSKSSDDRVELVASNCMLWADATIISSSDIHTVTLRAEDFHHLSIVKACLLTNLENHFDLIPAFAYPEGLNNVCKLAELFYKELIDKKTSLRVEMSKKQEHTTAISKVSGRSFSSEMELQMLTDRHFASILSNCVPWKS